MRAFDVAQTHRPHEAYLLLHRLGGPPGEAGQQLGPEFVAGALERQRQFPHIHLAQDALEDGGVEVGEVFEGEHLLADGLAELRVPLLEGAQEHFPLVFVHGVKEVGGDLAPARLVQGAGMADAPLGNQNLDDLFDDFDRCWRQRRDAFEDLVALLGLEKGQCLGALVRAGVAEYQRHGLRLLVPDEVVNLTRLHIDDLLDRADR